MSEPVIGPLHPMQPVITDAQGVRRFKQNALVAFLLDAGPFDMNQLMHVKCPNEDREQFAQLIGYSVSGFGDLPYVTDATWGRIEDEVAV